MEISTVLKEKMDEKDLTVYRVAKNAEVSQDTVKRALKDPGGLSLNTLKKVLGGAGLEAQILIA
jgi:DNA-binding phage protein